MSGGDDEPSGAEPQPEPPASKPDLVPADASPFDLPEGSGVESTRMPPGRRGTEERKPPRRR